MKPLFPMCIVGALALWAAPAPAQVLDARFVSPCGEAAITRPPPPARVSADVQPWRLALRFEDASTGALLPVRVGVFDASGRAIVPDDPAGALFQAVWEKEYFYADGTFEIGAPGGPVTVRAGRGFEYGPVDTTVVVSGDTELVVPLHRIADLAAAGWFSGDTHIHVAHPPVNYAVDAARADLAVRAEALAFASILELQDRFTGDVHPLSDSDHIVYYSKEHRNAHFSHLSIVGLKQWISDSGCVEGWAYCGRTLDREICDALHAQGDDVLVIATHPFSTLELEDVSPWPGGGVWRGMSMDLHQGVVDAVDLLCYTNEPSPAGIEFYPQILNAGFRLPPSAGTDANLASGWSYPPGGYRVYVKSTTGQPDFSGWVEGLRNGASFVTNHPLVTGFFVGGTGIGGTHVYGNARVKARLSVVSNFPVALIELVGDRGVIASATPPGDGRDFSWTVSFDPSGLHWVFARVSGPASHWHLLPYNGVFAQTAPVWMEYSFGLPATTPASDPGEPGPRAGAATYFKDFTQTVKRLFQSPVGNFPDPQSRLAFDDAVDAAGTYYEQLHQDPPLPFELLAPMDVPWPLGRPAVWTSTPQLRWAEAVDPEGDDVTYMVLIDTNPDFTAPLLYDGLSAASLQVPDGAGLQDGSVYHWKVIARDPLGNRRESAASDFVVVLTSTPAQTPVVGWSLEEPWPNPFSQGVTLRYSVPPGGGRVWITVYDATGAVVRRLLDREHAPGPAQAGWDGRLDGGARAPSGVYFFRLERAGAKPLVRRAILVR